MTWIAVTLVLLAAAVLAYWWVRIRPDGVSVAREALERSERERPEVDRLVHDLRARRARNNFAPLIEQALRRGP